MKRYSIIDRDTTKEIGFAFKLDDNTFSINIDDRFCGNFNTFESWNLHNYYFLSSYFVEVESAEPLEKMSLEDSVSYNEWTKSIDLKNIGYPDNWDLN